MGTMRTVRAQNLEDRAYYEELYDPDMREPGRPAKAAGKRKVKKSQAAAVAELADEAIGLEAGFVTTYQPARYETEFLESSLRQFYDGDLIVDVMASIKGGKEANVYRCKASPALGVEYVAAKVYRPRKFRNLRNDKLYREGRAVLAADGRPVKKTDHRIMRAINKKSTFGVQVSHTSWLMYEFTTLQRLSRAGAAVPTPYAVAENAILMGYIGDGQRAAPALNEIDLSRDEAHRLFDVVLDSVERMLQTGYVHGDLSPYNILYWEGAITLIDFPQVTDIRSNPSARSILHRDVQRVCSYFQARGVECHAESLVAGLWSRYRAKSEMDLLADLSRSEPEAE